MNNIVFKTVRAGLIHILAFSVLLCSSCLINMPKEKDISLQQWQEEFGLLDRELSDTGASKHFTIVPGFQVTLESQFEKLVITVLNEAKVINGFTARVLEERKERNGEIIEVSRNLFAIDKKTDDVFYFDEEVDMIVGDQNSRRSGAWLAHENNDLPSLIMPRPSVVAMKHYQEIAPSVAEDRIEVVSVSVAFQKQVGKFTDCLITLESSKIQPLAIEYKTDCPGIGIVQDQSLSLFEYGYIECTSKRGSTI